MKMSGFRYHRSLVAATFLSRYRRRLIYRIVDEITTIVEPMSTMYWRGGVDEKMQLVQIGNMVPKSDRKKGIKGENGRA
jgi:hypothetical protein